MEKIEYYDTEKLDVFLNRMIGLSDYTYEELIYYLMVKHTILPASYKTVRATPHVDIILGIGNDFTANLVMDEDAWEELQSMVTKEL